MSDEDFLDFLFIINLHKFARKSGQQQPLTPAGAVLDQYGVGRCKSMPAATDCHRTGSYIFVAYNEPGDCPLRRQSANGSKLIALLIRAAEFAPGKIDIQSKRLVVLPGIDAAEAVELGDPSDYVAHPGAAKRTLHT